MNGGTWIGRAVLGSFLPLSFLLFPSCAGVGRRSASLPDPPPIVRGFTSLYRVGWSDGGPRRKASLAVAFASPDRIRLEILDPLGGSRAVLVCAGGRGLLMNPPDRTYRSFDSGREALAALTGLTLDPGFLAAFLLGDPLRAGGLTCLPAERPGKSTLRCEGPGGDPIVLLEEGGARGEVRFRSGRGVIVSRSDGGGPRPGLARVLQLREPEGPIRVELEMREADFGAPGDDLFLTRPPPGFLPADPDAVPLLAEKAP